jgi:hypothetical protein
MSPFGQYQPATKGEIVSAAKAILDKWFVSKIKEAALSGRASLTTSRE